MSAKYAVVLLHGLGLSSLFMYSIQRYLRLAGFDVYTIDYPSRKNNIDSSVIYVEGEIKKLELECYDKVHIVGHSLGGIIARILRHNKVLHNLSIVVTIGSPSNGSSLAAMIGHFKAMRWYFGPALDDLVPGSSFMNTFKNVSLANDLIVGTNSKYALFGWWFDGVSDGTGLEREVIVSDIISISLMLHMYRCCIIRAF